ncbi:hypothetical protein Tco_1007929, partial [Tanacetum coccineum]
ATARMTILKQTTMMYHYGHSKLNAKVFVMQDDKSTKKVEAFKYTKCSFIRLPEKGINDGSLGLISSNVNNGQCQHENIVTKGAIIGNNAAVDNDESDVDLP